MADETSLATTNENGEEMLTSRYVLCQHVSRLKTLHGDKWKQTPEWAVKSRQLVNGELLAPIPINFKVAGADHFRADTPHKRLVPYHQRNVLSSNPPDIERRRLNESESGKLESTRVEQAVQAVMDDRYKYRDSVDKLLMEGVCLSITLPEMEAMNRVPSLWESDGKTIKDRYARNKAGKPRPGKRDSGYADWRVSKIASKKVHDEEVRSALSRRIPLKNELLGPSEFIPGFGPDLSLDFVIVERNWTVSDVLRFGWVLPGFAGHLSPAGPATDEGQVLSSDGGASVKVTEFHAVDYQDDGPHPYVALLYDGGKGNQVIQKRDKKSNNLIDHITDLRTEYGLTQPHFVLEWGQNWAHPDYDKKTMPFPLPFAQSWQQIDAMLTGAAVWLWWRGFPTLIEQPNANTPPEIESMTDSPDDDDTDLLSPLTIIRAKGTITELGSQGPSPILLQVIQFLSGANEDQGPPGSAFGGDAASGFQASLAKAYAEESQADVREGSIRLFKRTASVMAELLAGIAERYCDDKRLPIQRLTPVPLGSRAKGMRPKHEIIDITPSMFGDVYDIDASFPPQPNLAKGQQWAEWATLPPERGGPLVTLEEFRREIIGDRNPEIFMARRLMQLFQNSPQQLDRLAAIVAQLEGDESKRQQLQALQDGQAEQGTDGVIRPTAQGGTRGPGLTGAGGAPSIAGASLGGAVGGPIAAATQAAAAGGIVPNNIQMGPAG